MVARALRRAAPTGPLIKQPMLLVFKEKHGERYFYIPDDKALFAVALKIVSERFEEGYWYPEPGVEDKPAAPDYTKEQIATLPESMQKTATATLAAYERSLREYNGLVDEFKRIEKAVEEKDGQAAWQIIRERQRAEYEGYDLEHFETLDDREV